MIDRGLDAAVASQTFYFFIDWSEEWTMIFFKLHPPLQPVLLIPINSGIPPEFWLDFFACRFNGVCHAHRIRESY
jgi:hypothetical protein